MTAVRYLDYPVRRKECSSRGFNFDEEQGREEAGDKRGRKRGTRE